MPTKQSALNNNSLPSLTTEAGVERRILLIRGQKVMLDSDLAELYGVSTTRLNEQVKRNLKRFPEDFMFRLTHAEKQEVIANCDHLQKLKFSPVLPQAFTEHGAVMLASVLSSPVAIQASMQVVRAFVRLRNILAAHKELAKKLEAFEQKTDSRFKVVFELIAKYLKPESKKASRIGFETDEAK
jgi:hypothetical protein